jgi:hypothetical protein
MKTHDRPDQATRRPMLTSPNSLIDTGFEGGVDPRLGKPMRNVKGRGPRGDR